MGMEYVLDYSNAQGFDRYPRRAEALKLVAEIVKVQAALMGFVPRAGIAERKMATSKKNRVANASQPSTR